MSELQVTDGLSTCTESSLWLVLYLQADYGWSREGSVLGQFVFNVLINDLEEEIKCTLTKFAVYTKLRSAVSVLKGRGVFQRDLDRLEK